MNESEKNINISLEIRNFNEVLENIILIGLKKTHEEFLGDILEFT